ncbi:hypothetical protein T01_7370 [Trichinella spiralis]|uniref:Uncharacterized protein n=1 Tax=Trichinella spiralis TaxID=6334 RepID=A0A0V1AS71_TRISP|nr:hypothetical protein T01_7370 [Trichinella spiralis]
MLDVARVAANVICTSRPPELSTKRPHQNPWRGLSRNVKKLLEALGANINIAARKKQPQCYELCETPCSAEHLPNLCNDSCDKLSTFTFE